MRTDWEHLRVVSASAISPVLAYYTPTKGFLLALVLAFAFNIYAGMKADGVSFTCCENFSFGKFKNALAELVLYEVGFSAERVINAVNLGDCNVIQALQNCCCQTQRQIADFRGDLFLQNCKDTAELRNGQRDLGFAITTPNACKCQAETQVINERFVVAFQGRTTLPTSVTINQLGMTQGLIKIVCGKSNCYAINSSLSVSIPAEPAA